MITWNITGSGEYLEQVVNEMTLEISSHDACIRNEELAIITWYERSPVFILFDVTTNESGSSLRSGQLIVGKSPHAVDRKIK